MNWTQMLGNISKAFPWDKTKAHEISPHRKQRPIWKTKRVLQAKKRNARRLAHHMRMEQSNK
jgi:hypothetical protein